MNTPSHRERILGGLWGSLVGDALGVPVEFMSRPDVQRNPVADMRGFGTHRQPPGTWSDDSSMLLCTVESLCECGFSPGDLAARFLRWGREGYWTPHGDVFDIGIATSQALNRIAAGRPPLECGGVGDYDNGNGSLMRILPICLYFAGADAASLAGNVEDASAITHAHRRSQMACFFHALLVRRLLAGAAPHEALSSTQKEFATHYAAPWSDELVAFSNALDPALPDFPEAEIRSGGYVMDTLTAAIWCLLTTGNFRECVLKAVNLGGDTDTTGCVAGGLAGILYGQNAIEPGWIAALARKDEVAHLLERFAGLNFQK
jgi:ADP-ribosyl-[dinitrogen reductase] hydrolase